MTVPAACLTCAQPVEQLEIARGPNGRRPGICVVYCPTCNAVIDIPADPEINAGYQPAQRKDLE